MAAAAVVVASSSLGRKVRIYFIQPKPRARDDRGERGENGRGGRGGGGEGACRTEIGNKRKNIYFGEKRENKKAERHI